MRRGLAIAAASLALAGSAGYLTARAVGAQQAPPVQTVTVTLRNGATGPAGPRGATGAAGPLTCPAGFEPGVLVVNHPGGQVRLFSCLDGN